MYNLDTLGQFAQFLTYKEEEVGNKVIRIEYSHTSQQCYRCGKRIKRTFSECFITCDCGNCIDRDLNSAIIILESFINKKQHFDFLSHQPSMTEESFRERGDLLRNTVPSPQTRADGELVVNGRLGL
jgi:transposase